MSKYIISFCLLLWSSIFFSSCKEAGAETELKELMGDKYRKKISFPVEVTLLNKQLAGISTDSQHVQTNSTGYTIVHFFTADCDKCIEELTLIQNFIKGRKAEPNVRYVFITSAPAKVFAEDAIKKIGFGYPVYYEKNYFSFKIMNQLPLDNKLYNTMLLNSNNEVLLFGAFFTNKKAERLFFNTIANGI